MTKPFSASTEVSDILGTFHGFSVREGKPLDRRFTTNEVIGWDHQAGGEVEFTPSGDSDPAKIVFTLWRHVPGDQLMALAAFLETLDSKTRRSPDTYLRIYRRLRFEMESLTPEVLSDPKVFTAFGYNSQRAVSDVAWAVLGGLFPEIHDAISGEDVPGLMFDPTEFLAELGAKPVCFAMSTGGHWAIVQLP